jgi:hypothetical protein
MVAIIYALASFGAGIVFIVEEGAGAIVMFTCHEVTRLRIQPLYIYKYHIESE